MKIIRIIFISIAFLFSFNADAQNATTDTLVTNCQILHKQGIEQSSRKDYIITFNNEHCVFAGTDEMRFILSDTLQKIENFYEKRVTIATQYSEYVLIFQYYENTLAIVAIKRNDDTYLFHIFNPDYTVQN